MICFSAVVAAVADGRKKSAVLVIAIMIAKYLVSVMSSYLDILGRQIMIRTFFLLPNASRKNMVVQLPLQHLDISRKNRVIQLPLQHSNILRKNRVIQLPLQHLALHVTS